MADLSVTTTAGETFTLADSQALATLVFRRFGRDPELATRAWNRLLENNVGTSSFMALVDITKTDRYERAARLLAGSGRIIAKALADANEAEEAAKLSLNRGSDLRMKLETLGEIIDTEVDVARASGVNVDVRKSQKEEEEPVDGAERLCSVPGCLRTRLVGVLCTTHYSRAKVLGLGQYTILTQAELAALADTSLGR